MASPRRRYIIDLGSAGHFCGLFNQLNGLSGMMVLGHLLEADLLVRGFYPRFQQPDRIPLSTVIDLPALNTTSITIGLRCQIYDYQGEEYTTYPCPPTGTLRAYATQLAEHPQLLDLGKIYSATTTMFIESDLLPYYHQVLCQIRFTPPYYNAVEQIKKHLQLEKYHAVHLRLESDTKIYSVVGLKDYDGWLRRLQLYYHEQLGRLTPQLPIYVASGLSEVELTPWLKLFPSLRWKPSTWRKLLGLSLPEGREIDAIIDYLLVREATIFLGMQASTFSQAIEIYRTKQLKPSILS
jgi:hypothetical protein